MTRCSCGEKVESCYSASESCPVLETSIWRPNISKDRTITKYFKILNNHGLIQLNEENEK